MRHILIGVIITLTIMGCEKSVDRYAIVKGKQMHILDRGTGKPTVVFLTGQICPLEFFYTVQSQISKRTRTFSYDRSGLGLSDIIDTVRTLDRAARELNALLDIEKIEPPYILVGHSLGGLIAREFYNQYPNKVSGFVFVDVANYEVLFDSLYQKKLASDEDFGPDSLATKGESYEMNYTKQNVFWFKEKGYFKTDLPVHLLVASGKKAGSDEFVATKVNTFKLFSKGAPQMKIIYTEFSGHHIQRDQPELVIKSINEIIDEIKGSN
jgi:pimeloyl-ACP methyl ester carboxylesterase